MYLWLEGIVLAAAEQAHATDVPWLLYYLALVPALGVIAQWIAWQTRLPGILLLLLFGILLGQFVNPDELIANVTGGESTAGPRVLFPLVSLSVAVILFEGGLSLKMPELREAGTAVLRLVTIGAVVTVILTTLAAHYILGFGWRISLLMAAILVVTGPTVISPLLRQVRPNRRVESTLRWEGIVIDPIGAILAVLVFEEFLSADEEFDLFGAGTMLLRTTLVGLVLGGIGAIGLVQCFRRYWVPDFLQGVLALSVAMVLFSTSNYLAEESGLITVTLLGVMLANQKTAAIGHVIEFKENLRSLLIGCLFILLGSRIEPYEVLGLGIPGLIFIAVMILVVRPVAAAISLAGSQLNWRERAFVASLAPRGIVAAAVTSVFALKLEGSATSPEAVSEAARLVAVTFLVILSTVTVYGLAAGPIARTLGLARLKPQGLLIAGADHWVREMAKVLHENNVPLLLVDTNYNKISAARMAGLPAECVNILSEHAWHEIELGSIGRMLAVTPNDEVNSLAVQEFRHRFSRAGVFQLTFKSHSSPERRAPAAHLRGRVLFGPDWTFTKMRETVAAGAMFKATRLSDSFSYADFLQRYGDGTLLLFVIDGADIYVNALDQKLNPKSGDVVVALVPAVPIPPEHASAPRPQGDSEASRQQEEAHRSHSVSDMASDAASG